MTSKNQNSDNLSKGDIISFLAIILMGVLVFFGVNFQSLGDKIQSVVVSVVLVVFLTVFIFLAGFARGQNRNQSTWKTIEYSMIALYLVTLIPTYLYISKFFDIQFDKAEIAEQATKDMDDINKMFVKYDKLCQSRCYGYQTALKAMSMDSQGRSKIANMLGINAESISDKTIKQASEIFLNKLRGDEYSLLKTELTSLDNNVVSHFKNWNIILVPQYASELGEAKAKFAKSLEQIYNNNKNSVEKNIPEFDIADLSDSDDNIAERFQKMTTFSLLGLLAALVLGGLGFSKYIFSTKRTVIEFKEGDTSVINDDGGFAF